MDTHHKSDFSAQRWFYLFLILHVLAWTFAPAIIRNNLPLDAMEGTVWGHQLQWGYDKNPFLNAFLTTFADSIGGEGMIYLFSQISVAACFWVVWKLGKNWLTPVYALIAVMLLEGVQYFNFHAIDFNDNTLELGLWALTIYFLYHALRVPTYRSWILTGFFAGFSMMAKYYTLALLAALAIFLFTDKDSRKQLLTLPPYVGLLTFIIIILPHTIWLFFHEFMTVTYVFARTSSEPSWLNHFYFPAEFTWQQLQVFIPALIMFGLLFLGRKPILESPQLSLSTFDKRFLFWAGFGPFVLTILLAAALGLKLRAGWGMPLLSFWTIGLLALVQPRISAKKFHVFIFGIFFLIAILVYGYTKSITQSKSTSSANFPGPEIAEAITQEWHARFDSKLEYVAGSRWIGGNIGYYSDDHPAVFMEWDEQRSPWIDVEDLREKGAAFVWYISDDETLPAHVNASYPDIKDMFVWEFSWHRNVSELPPVKIGVIFLPPKSNAAKVGR